MKIQKRKRKFVLRFITNKPDLVITGCETQKDMKRLARYHSSVIDIGNLHSGQEFKELPDTYTIFIIEKDFYGKGGPIYPIERVNLATGTFFEDGEHILYVNGEYREASDLGKLMHDFNCTQAEVALRMLAAGKYALEEIANISGLSFDELNKLKSD